MFLDKENLKMLNALDRRTFLGEGSAAAASLSAETRQVPKYA